MRSWKAAFYPAIALFLSVVPAAAETDWRAATIEDLDAARSIIDQHTPAHADKENSRMAAWFDKGYEIAKGRAESVTNYAGWHAVLSAYVNGFGDPHLSLSAEDGLPVGRWPGFVVGARGADAQVVWRADDAAPRIGAKLRGCDGADVATLAERNIFSHTLNARLAVDQRKAIPRLFLDRGVPFAPPIKTCQFEPGGSIDLSWRPVPQSLDDPMWRAYRDAALGPRTVPGLSRPAPGIVWIGAPGFLPIGDDNKNMTALVKAVREEAAQIRSARAIVIDVRGNSGGSSAWGDRLAAAIWGEDILKRYQLDTSGEAVDWRASKANADYVKAGSMLLRIRFPGSGIGKEWGETIGPGIARAVKEGRPFFRNGAERPWVGGGLTRARPKGPSPIPATVYFLTNGSCASACLDFADIALNIPGVIHIGSETSGDGLLMELRSIKLPSRRGSISAPIKVVRGRARGDLEVYEPDVRYDGPWADDAVRAWTLDLISQRGGA